MCICVNSVNSINGIHSVNSVNSSFGAFTLFTDCLRTVYGSVYGRKRLECVHRLCLCVGAVGTVYAVYAPLQNAVNSVNANPSNAPKLQPQTRTTSIFEPIDS